MVPSHWNSRAKTAYQNGLMMDTNDQALFPQLSQGSLNTHPPTQCRLTLNAMGLPKGIAAGFPVNCTPTC